MITLQEQIEKCFPDKSAREINVFMDSEFDKNFTNYDLDLSEYVNLTVLDLSVCCTNLRRLLKYFT